MFKYLLILMFCTVFAGCDNPYTHVSQLNGMTRPLVVVTASPGGGVLIRGGKGELFLATYDTYLGEALKNCKPGDVLAPKQ